MGYVARQGDGSFIAVGDDGWSSVFQDQQAAEQAYNAHLAYTRGQSDTALVPTRGNGGLTDDITTYPYGLVDQKLQAAQQQYLRERLRLIDEPGLELQKHQLALDKATKFAQLSGWMIPSDFLESSLSSTGVVPPKVAPEDMANIRQQLQQAGWPGGSDSEAIDAFLNIAQPDATNGPLLQRLRAGSTGGGGTTTGSYSTKNGPKTIQQMEQELRSAGWGGGEDVAQAYARTTGGQVTPSGGTGGGGYGGIPGIPNGAIPTMEMANLLGNPRNIGQSLIMLGNTPQQAGNILNSMPLVRGLEGYPGVSFPGQFNQQPQAGAGGYVGIETGPQFFPDGTRNPMYLPQQGGSNPIPNYFMGEQPGGVINKTAPQGVNRITMPFTNPLDMSKYSPEDLNRQILPIEGGWGQPNTAIGRPVGPGYALGGQQGLVPQGQEGTRNPFFQFVSGRHIPAQQGMNWMNTNSQMVPLISGLASFSGQDPSAFWGEWQSFLPRGARNPLSSFM